MTAIIQVGCFAQWTERERTDEFVSAWHSSYVSFRSSDVPHLFPRGWSNIGQFRTEPSKRRETNKKQKQEGENQRRVLFSVLPRPNGERERERGKEKRKKKGNWEGDHEKTNKKEIGKIGQNFETGNDTSRCSMWGRRLWTVGTLI